MAEGWKRRGFLQGTVAAGAGLGGVRRHRAGNRRTGGRGAGEPPRAPVDCASCAPPWSTPRRSSEPTWNGRACRGSWRPRGGTHAKAPTGSRWSATGPAGTAEWCGTPAGSSRTAASGSPTTAPRCGPAPATSGGYGCGTRGARGTLERTALVGDNVVAGRVRRARWIGAGTPPQPPSFEGADWIWSPGATPSGAPEGPRWFRGRLTLPAGTEVERAAVVATADDDFTLYLGGEQVLHAPQQTDRLAHRENRGRHRARPCGSDRHAGHRRPGRGRRPRRRSPPTAAGLPSTRADCWSGCSSTRRTGSATNWPPTAAGSLPRPCNGAGNKRTSTTEAGHPRSSSHPTARAPGARGRPWRRPNRPHRCSAVPSPSARRSPERGCTSSDSPTTRRRSTAARSGTRSSTRGSPTTTGPSCTPCTT
ncbi:hypothetical protein SHIRM173S_07814 [Streptomyces hirsutus]